MARIEPGLHEWAGSDDNHLTMSLPVPILLKLFKTPKFVHVIESWILVLGTIFLGFGA